MGVLPISKLGFLIKCLEVSTQNLCTGCFLEWKMCCVSCVFWVCGCGSSCGFCVCESWVCVCIAVMLVLCVVCVCPCVFWVYNWVCVCVSPCGICVCVSWVSVCIAVMLVLSMSIWESCVCSCCALSLSCWDGSVKVLQELNKDNKNSSVVFEAIAAVLNISVPLMLLGVSVASGCVLCVWNPITVVFSSVFFGRAPLCSLLSSVYQNKTNIPCCNSLINAYLT